MPTTNTSSAMGMRERIARAIHGAVNDTDRPRWFHAEADSCRLSRFIADTVLAELREEDLVQLLMERKFDANVARSGECWEWQGAIDKRDGYGRFYIGDGKTRGAHQFSYQRENGPVPDGLVVDHICRNRRCVNPAHLQAVTNTENVLSGDGITALNAAKTHCPHGHAYSLENTYVRPDGGRHCRVCSRARHRELRSRKTAKRRQSMIDEASK